MQSERIAVNRKLLWQHELANAITDPAELLKLLQLDMNLLPAAQRVAKLFDLRVPRNFVARMRKGDIKDPLLHQVLPLAEELVEQTGFTQDPLHEKTVNPLPGLLHKYQGRVLLTVTGACAINCRYCFRRHFDYQANTPGTKDWQHVIDYIAKDTTIHEVIFSGGDPLIASDHYLSDLAQRIAAIPHIKTLRIHSRLPIVLPQRVTDELIQWLTQLPLRLIIVVHCNHPNEIDETVTVAAEKFRRTKIIVLNQSVLLKGVNDNVATLTALSEKLFDNGILPYYLHLFDKVQNAAHFAVSEKTAVQFMNQLLKQLPGYLVPKLVCEQAGMLAKVPISISLSQADENISRINNGS